ncbi:glycosyltransferase family 2 protein [Candidatus Woesearchaeota archaeon]|nr:glycosyltransferase family 2 protein [Candidatus Woesearchaeota archaeon]
MGVNIAILICTYNGVKSGIEACLNSILKLDYPAKEQEIILVNDCSTDATTEIVNNYKRAFERKGIVFRHLVNKKNLGLYGSKERGVLALSKKAEIVLVTDDDCEVHPTWAFELVKPYQDTAVGSVGGVDRKQTPGQRPREIRDARKEQRPAESCECPVFPWCELQLSERCFAQDRQFQPVHQIGRRCRSEFPIKTSRVFACVPANSSHLPPSPHLVERTMGAVQEVRQGRSTLAEDI